ncbi:DNA processing protein [Amycolatopsis xylanica]|uniref:DNA processing protein n=1 Tax=Amycolatopsis xylanica TaxID=589385 RepID=A0A1H3R5R3_9PSEU|nr:DNA-processing protein DprA [Amycolatopsis xylanica]SDZ20289.1 DNA processing protein [Amycolatopsis xylanica]
MSVLDDQRLARAYLVRVAEPPATELVSFVGELGPVDAADRVRARDCPEKVWQETSARAGYDLAEQDLAEAERLGARLVIPEDDEWPSWPLHSLTLAQGNGIREAVPPLALWVRGQRPLDEAADNAIAIVGARAATGYGEHVASELGFGLASAGFPIFSGAAYGIDGAAHRGALASEGFTVAVLGCALDAGYPAGHEGLLNRIAESGVVISEYPMGTSPAKHRFLVRNRLIAALTEGTIVVEAGQRSGARNTAATAGALGKVVMAVPGPITSAMSVGCHDLIREAHASLVTSVQDVAGAVGKLAAGEQPRASPRRRTDRLGPEALRVHEALAPRRAKSVQHIAAESGVPVSRVRALLPALEIDGFAEHGEAGWRRLDS